MESFQIREKKNIIFIYKIIVLVKEDDVCRVS